MARTKSTRTSASKSTAKSASKSDSKSAPKSARSTKAQSASRASGRSSNGSSNSQDEGFSISRARGYVEDNVNLQTAGIALAGAGILALISSAAGRSLIRTAASSVARLAQENIGEYFGQSGDSAEDGADETQRPSRQRNQDRA